MRVLLLGSGGREHALAWKLSQSSHLTSLVAAPGNPGIEGLARCLSLDVMSPSAVTDVARREQIDLVVVGPEAPLVAGMADALLAAGFAVFGPTAAAARIEGSKAFAKEIMLAAHVPTAKAQVFTDLEAALAAAVRGGPVAVKADGLAGGKGVIVTGSGEEAAEAVKALGKIPAGRQLLLEERLVGPELSVMALCDGEQALLLPPSQDHKRLRDGDQGPNTGGMGAYAPARLLGDVGLERVRQEIIIPTLAELSRRGSPFRGVLYAGLMLTAEGPKVIEFNCRFGDPETQVLVMQLEDDLLPLMLAAATSRLPASPLRTRSGVSVGVVLAAPGYPEAPKLGAAIKGLDAAVPDGVVVFHAGTKRNDSGSLVTAGGRVLTVCAHGATVTEARAKALAQARAIDFEGRQFRQDIAAGAPPDLGIA